MQTGVLKDTDRFVRHVYVAECLNIDVEFLCLNILNILYIDIKYSQLLILNLVNTLRKNVGTVLLGT